MSPNCCVHLKDRSVSVGLSLDGANMKLEVLLSCMDQADESLIEQSQITSDALLINQCDNEGTYDLQRSNQQIRRIDTAERGLSNSRNMAIEYAKGDICLLCDDDEIFFPNYEGKIIDAFNKLPKADLIAFRITNHPCRLKKRIQKLKWMQCLRVSSCQIAFRRESIQNSPVRFDPFMGAGSGNGAGEEVKFLLDCMKHGMSIYSVPIEIGSLRQAESTWFRGFDADFFYKRGCSTRYMLGLPFSMLYALYYAICKWRMYANELTIGRALFETYRGIFSNEIHHQKMAKG